MTALVFNGAVHADAVADFYKGKTLRILIGYGAGGGYDTTTRMFAKHLSRHIPGNPTIVPQNMPGAGSMKVANFLYNAAPKDGTSIGVFARSSRCSATRTRSSPPPASNGSAACTATPQAVRC